MTRTLGILHTQVQFPCEFRCNRSKKQVKIIAAKSEVRVHFQSVLSCQAVKSLDCISTSYNLKKSGQLPKHHGCDDDTFHLYSCLTLQLGNLSIQPFHN